MSIEYWFASKLPAPDHGQESSVTTDHTGLTTMKAGCGTRRLVMAMRSTRAGHFLDDCWLSYLRIVKSGPDWAEDREINHDRERAADDAIQWLYTGIPN